MATVRVFPAEGRLVRHPETKVPIGADGLDVDDADPFWYRRILDGDVCTSRPSAPPPPAKRTAPTEE